jgi:hypothetical protein
MKIYLKTLAGVLFAAIFLLPGAGNVHAHCDTLDGPVIAEARQALLTGDVTPVLKWVGSEEEESIKAAFKHTMAVRQLGDEAGSLADAYFFETLVRIHRAGEGEPYTGLKPGTAIDPAVALADRALAQGSVDKLADVLGDSLRKGLHQRFEAVIASAGQAETSIEAGRRYVEDYVQFTHFAEKIHGILQEGEQHHDHH